MSHCDVTPLTACTTFTEGMGAMKDNRIVCLGEDLFYNRIKNLFFSSFFSFSSWKSGFNDSTRFFCTALKSKAEIFVPKSIQYQGLKSSYRTIKVLQSFIFLPAGLIVLRME